VRDLFKVDEKERETKGRKSRDVKEEKTRVKQSQERAKREREKGRERENGREGHIFIFLGRFCAPHPWTSLGM
jgi:hypothetical protein